MSFLCKLSELADTGSKGIQHGDDSVFVVLRDGQYYAYRNSCPHLGVELNWLEDQFLDRGDALIQCATHGALFIIESGECIAGPCQGASLQPLALYIRNDELHLA
ncbi:MAG: nitrite reductase/ring-hydroxylating ferredoxin subunit [Bermanella sp.]|jgi:nitrite reductase/ring-hydroxylating ferredoxin subunit